MVSLTRLPIKQDEAALASFWTNVHCYLPVFGLGPLPTTVRGHDGLNMVTYMALSLVYLFQEAAAMPSSEDKTCFALQYYLEHFTSLLGREVDHVCLSNIRPFLLRRYLATFEGKIESATIFTGRSAPALSQPATDGDTAASTSHYYCRESAKYISSLLKKYRQHFDNRVMDFMAIHSAFTGALVHFVLLEHPHLASYDSSICGFKIIIDTLRWIMLWSG